MAQKVVKEVQIRLVCVGRRRRVGNERRGATRASNNRINTGKYESTTQLSPVVNVRRREGNASGILDIQIRF